MNQTSAGTPSLTATILQLERISRGPGRGLQTVIFFKGCPMSCAWCPTPEDRSYEPELLYHQERCRGCGKCVKVCPNGALTLVKEGRVSHIVRDTEKCKNCFLCTSACTARALRVCGTERNVDEVFQEILKNEIIQSISGGGIYLRGGDIARFSPFATELLKRCSEHNISATAELTMYAPYETIEPMLPYLDTITTEMKMMVPELHEEWTGVNNQIILDNLRKADTQCKKDALQIRVPLIWNINDNFMNITKTVEFCRELKNCSEVNFLPYDKERKQNYYRLSQDYELDDLPTMTYNEAWKKVSFLCNGDWPFTIKVGGRVIHERPL